MPQDDQFDPIVEVLDITGKDFFGFGVQWLTWGDTEYTFDELTAAGLTFGDLD